MYTLQHPSLQQYQALTLSNQIMLLLVIAHSYGTLILHCASEPDWLFNHTIWKMDEVSQIIPNYQIAVTSNKLIACVDIHA